MNSERRPRTRGPRSGRGRGPRVRGGRGRGHVVEGTGGGDGGQLGGNDARGRGVVVRGGLRRGARGGGGGPSRAPIRPGPSSIDELLISHVDDLPEGVGLETRLHPKRRRFWDASQPIHTWQTNRPTNPQESVAPPASVIPEATPASVEISVDIDVPVPFPLIPVPVPSAAAQSPAVPSPAPMECGTADPNRVVGRPGARDIAQSPAVTPPAAYMECAGPSRISRPAPCHRPLEDKEIENALYGSEGDTDSDDNEDCPVSVFLPRKMTVLQETPMDEPPELVDSCHVLPNMCFMPAVPEYPPPSGIEHIYSPESPAPSGMEHMFDLLDSPTGTQPATPNPGHISPQNPPHDSPPPPADITDTYEPRELYNFEWKSFPSPPLDPSLRREKFSYNNVGPTVALTDPYELFMSVWDRQIMQHIVEETNRYAQQRAFNMIQSGTLKPMSRISQWKDTDINEIYVYFAIAIAMGTVQRSCIEDYWSKKSAIHETPGFRLYMSYNRFNLLTMCLHFRNNDEMFDANLSYPEAKLFKIMPILVHLNQKFPALYNLNQNLSLDESLLLWKGRLEINQLIPNKAAAIGIKSFEVCESQTGYLWRFEIHAQRKGAITQPGDILKTSTPAIVLRLVHGLENKGYTLWMDNYYNSPALARHLKSLGFDCAGTLRTNRQFVPQALHKLTKQTMRPGEFTGVTSGDVDVMVWRDANRVALISTYHGNGVVRDLESTKPILIEDYNIAMGGVDKKDQMCAGFPVERKRCKVWYKKLFKRLMNVSILNTYIIHLHNSQKHNTRPLLHKDYRIQLVDTILSKHGHIKTNTSQARHTTPAPTQNVVDITHHLSEFEARVGPRGEKPRRKCTVCRKRVSTFCVGCDKTLCLAGDCFVISHST